MNDEERYADYLEGGTLDGTLDEGARGELDELRRLFASPNTWNEPPPDLADDIVAGIRAAGAVTPESAPVRRAPRRRAPRMILAAAAAVLVLVIALGAVLSTRGGTDGEAFSLAATEVIPGASGQASVESTGSGLSISLTVDGLAPAPSRPGWWCCAARSQRRKERLGFRPRSGHSLSRYREGE